MTKTRDMFSGASSPRSAPAQLAKTIRQSPAMNSPETPTNAPSSEPATIPHPSARIAFGHKCAVCGGEIRRPRRGMIARTCGATCRKRLSRRVD